jgi:hypothetical protein
MSWRDRVGNARVRMGHIDTADGRHGRILSGRNSEADLSRYPGAGRFTDSRGSGIPLSELMALFVGIVELTRFAAISLIIRCCSDVGSFEPSIREQLLASITACPRPQASSTTQ